MLKNLGPFLGDFEVMRDYRIKSSSDFKPTIFIQGGSEQTHGLSDTLLSVTAVRAGEIVESLLEAVTPQKISTGMPARHQSLRRKLPQKRDASIVNPLEG